MTLCIKKKSDTYGKIKYQCIGVVDFSEIIKKLGSERANLWIEKYHPKSYFGSLIMIQISYINSDDFSLREMGKYAIFVPSKKLNKDWDSEYWCKKYNLKNKKQSLPIVVENEKIEEWVNSISDNILTPDNFVSAKSLSELQSDLPSYQKKTNIENIDCCTI